MNQRDRRIGAMAVLFVGLLTGCGPRVGPGSSGDGNRITGAELVESNAYNVYEALERLRPSWMTSRGAASINSPVEARANVYIGRNRMGSLDYLRQVSVAEVDELRYYESGEAAARFGMDNPRGVIQIVPKRWQAGPGPAP